MRLSLLLLLSACATKAAPIDVLADYLHAEQRGRYDEAWRLLSPTDRVARPLDAYAAEHLAAGPVWLAVAARTHFSLQVTERDADAVRVAVTATHPDMDVVVSLVPGLPPEALASVPDPMAAMRAQVEAVLDARELPLTADTTAYAVHHADGAWSVWLGLDLQDAAIAHTAAALRAADRGDAAAVRRALESVLGLKPDPAGVVAMLQGEARARLAVLDAAP